MLPGRFSQLPLIGAIFWTGPGLNRPTFERLSLVGNDQIEIEVEGVAESLATRAGAVGIVEEKSLGSGSR